MFFGTLHLVLMSYGYDGNKKLIENNQYFDSELETYNVFL